MGAPCAVVGSAAASKARHGRCGEETFGHDSRLSGRSGTMRLTNGRPGTRMPSDGSGAASPDDAADVDEEVEVDDAGASAGADADEAVAAGASSSSSSR